MKLNNNIITRNIFKTKLKLKQKKRNKNCIKKLIKNKAVCLFSMKPISIIKKIVIHPQ